jgi:hypothetical protein
MDSLINQSQIAQEAIEKLPNSKELLGFSLGILNDYFHEETIQEFDFVGILDAYRNVKPVITIIEQYLTKKKN